MESKWHQPWSEPVRFKILPAMAIALAAASGNSFNPLPIPASDPSKIVSDWFAPFTDPVRLPPRLTTGAQKADFLVEAAPFTEAVLESKWHIQWQDPVRIKPDLGAARQQFQPQNPFGMTQPETILESEWHFPWSEPVRLRPAPLLTADQKADWLVEAAPFPETTNYAKWGYAWSEPVRLRPPPFLTAQQQAWTGVHDVDIQVLGPTSWYAPFTDPVRFRPTPLLTADQKADWLVEAAPFTEAVLESKWHFAWSEPVRTKPGLLPSEQPFIGPIVIEPLFPNYRLTVRNVILRYAPVKGQAWPGNTYPPTNTG
jgi:hypothetical protein